MSRVQRCAIASVRLYQQVLSPLLGPACRYQPSCSQYAIEAIALHGMLHGCRLAFGRLLRCAPWGHSGWDPVPRAGLRIRGPHGS